jgi:hypothetical protein
MRILYGLDRLPRTLDPEDPRLPSVLVGPAMLRMNSFPLAAASWGEGNGHADRVAAYQDWLLAQCGDYNAALRRRVIDYLSKVTASLQADRESLERRLDPFDGLYQVADWFWSAARPLPRAWWFAEGTWQHLDLAFWDGERVTGEAPAKPIQSQALPSSPFRRPQPAGFFDCAIIS